MLKAIQFQRAGVSALVLEGREAILEHSGLLEELADRCNQTGTMGALSHFLDTTPSYKFPHLLLLLYPGASPKTFAAMMFMLQFSSLSIACLGSPPASMPRMATTAFAPSLRRSRKDAQSP